MFLSSMIEMQVRLLKVEERVKGLINKIGLLIKSQDLGAY